MRTQCHFIAGVLLLPALAAGAVAGQSLPLEAKLRMPVPEAPVPVATAGGATTYREPTVFLASSNSKYSTVVKPGQKVVPFTPKEKMIFSLRESVSTEQLFVVTLSGGYNHLIDGNPHFGSDANGFGERVGSAALREASIHIQGDGIAASIFHQDPRYFRQGKGRPFKQRVGHVFASVVTSHADSDERLQPDYSGITGRAATAIETLGYYPHTSAKASVATESFGYSFLGELGGNAFLEFWPDILHSRERDNVKPVATISH